MLFLCCVWHEESHGSGVVAARAWGLNDTAFREAFGSEEQHRSALARLRWSGDFVCPGCGHRGYCFPTCRPAYQYNRCENQISLMAGTIFHWSKLPLTVWFRLRPSA